MRTGWYNEIEAFVKKYEENCCFVLICRKCDFHFFMEVYDNEFFVMHSCHCTQDTRHATLKSYTINLPTIFEKEFILECATCKKEFKVALKPRIHNHIRDISIGDCDCEGK